MLTKFQPATAFTITRPVSTRIIQSKGFVHIGEVARQVLGQMIRDPHEAGLISHERIIAEVNQARARTRQSPENACLVYELCKRVYDLAEIESVDFNAAGYLSKLKLIRQLVPFADVMAISEGVMEYHESRIDMNWRMNFLSDENGSDQEVMKA